MDTPSEFLAKLGQKLKDSEGIDQDLAQILVENILSSSPASDCVKKASKAIADLAEDRATPEENEDGK